jgi:hypothetical protein|tara:strand:- start:592 stop:765 length:174 start_codon:yes stop_codon:yes gene_type:complete
MNKKYYYDGMTIYITRKNFAQISKDYKRTTKGNERMLHYDWDTGGTMSVPVKFTEEE